MREPASTARLPLAWLTWLTCLFCCLPLRSTARSWSYSLAPSRNEGMWQEFPLPAASHLNKSGMATSFWRQNGRHPWNRFDEVKGALPLDSFTVAVWVKVHAAFWTPASVQSGVFWELSCFNCDGATESSRGAPYVRQTAELANAAAAAAAVVCPVSIRLEATPQQAVVHTVAPNDQSLAACAPMPQQTQIINGVQKVADGKWHHVAVVFDAAQDSNNPNPSVVARGYRFELWVDGKLDGTAEGPQNLRILKGRKAHELTIGRVSDFTNGGTENPNYMRSTMDSLEILDYPMSAQEIATLAKVDCIMENWSDWSECRSDGIPGSVNRERTRSRSIKQWPLNGGLPCSLVTTEKKPCVTQIGSTFRSGL